MQIRLHVDNDNPLGSSALFLSHSVNVKTLGGVHFCVHSLHTHKHTYLQTHCTCRIFSDIPIGTKSSLSPGSKLGLSLSCQSEISRGTSGSPGLASGGSGSCWGAHEGAGLGQSLHWQCLPESFSPARFSHLPAWPHPPPPYPSHSPIYPCSTLVYSVNTPVHLHGSFVTLWLCCLEEKPYVLTENFVPGVIIDQILMQPWGGRYPSQFTDKGLRCWEVVCLPVLD